MQLCALDLAPYNCREASACLPVKAVQPRLGARVLPKSSSSTGASREKLHPDSMKAGQHALGGDCWRPS